MRGASLGARRHWGGSAEKQPRSRFSNRLETQGDAGVTALVSAVRLPPEMDLPMAFGLLLDRRSGIERGYPILEDSIHDRQLRQSFPVPTLAIQIWSRYPSCHRDEIERRYQTPSSQVTTSVPSIRISPIDWEPYPLLPSEL